tara:strand:- start:877 stop:1032 length:156 start_codon:yes stop_codon:yes gene_type:complete
MNVNIGQAKVVRIHLPLEILLKERDVIQLAQIVASKKRNIWTIFAKNAMRF